MPNPTTASLRGQTSPYPLQPHQHIMTPAYRSWYCQRCKELLHTKSQGYAYVEGLCYENSTRAHICYECFDELGFAVGGWGNPVILIDSRIEEAIPNSVIHRSPLHTPATQAEAEQHSPPSISKGEMDILSKPTLEEMSECESYEEMEDLLGDLDFEELE